MSNHSNSVELLGYYGGDKRVCLSAWQSTTEELGIQLPETIQDRVDVIFSYIAASKKKSPFELIDFLAEHNHGTPFEKAHLDFQIKGDLASHIHSLKHRLSGINSESPRYKEFTTDKFYLPQDWKGIKVSTGLEYYEEDGGFDAVVVTGSEWLDILAAYSKFGFDLYHQAIDDIEKQISRKRAKESARYFLGYNTQLNYDWQMNFRSFVNIQRLRNDDHAQREIHFIANTMLHQVTQIPGNPFEYCLKAFNLEVDPNYILE